MAITEERARRIHSEETLFDFLRQELGWPVASQPDTYPFFADELGLTETEAQQIKQVRQIAPFEKNQPWGIFLVEFKDEKVSNRVLRRVLRGLSETRRNGDASLPAWKAANLLFICTTNFQDFSFARFDGQTHTRATLSLFGWDEHDSGLRTLCEYNLPALVYPQNVADTDQWLAQWATAWNVERVTQRFYEEYEAVFKQAETLITGVAGDKRMFTQRLFNRLMFIQFLSKKRWLRFPSPNGKDYLAALWEGRDQTVNFYTAHLCPLFFAALNNPHIHRDLGTDSVLRSRIGQAPYLNGGLFQKYQDEGCGESLPDTVFDLIINRLFAKFNFTVHESTPLDIEVAVDPEMLGKVFEELVTGRHESGSYYTPRPVVAFMCKEALKGYLGSPLPSKDNPLTPDNGGTRSEFPMIGVEGLSSLEAGRQKESAIAALVDHHDASTVSVPQARRLLHQLAEVKVVDPACGSGAYLLGMLQELFALNQALDTRAKQFSARDDYKRKLDIIRSNLYGVDLDDFAVQITRLRLWLSLAVEYSGEIPEPLPNLDFKVEQGDSLSAPDPQGGPTADIFRQKDIEEFSLKKAQYADPYYEGDKAALKRDIHTLRDSIAAWAHPTESVQGFDWRVEFAEVFEAVEPITDLGGAMNFGGTLTEPPRSGGFDIVLANPPYVRQELIRDQKPTLAKVYPEVFVGTADLYCFFYARALQLLAPKGMLVFISPNKWFRAGYGAKLRKHIAETCRVFSITDFGDLPVFQAATTYPMIFVANKGGPSGSAMFTQVKSLSAPYPDVLALLQRDGQRLPANALAGADWTLTDAATADRLRKMEQAGIPLGEYVKGQIYYGIKTGFNTAFVIDGAKRAELLAADPRSTEIIKPLVAGKDVKRWTIHQRDTWLIFTRRGIDIECYPAIKNHMAQWKAELTPKTTGMEPQGRKPGSYKWYEIQDEIAYFAAFDKPKIIYPQIMVEPQFTYDDSGTFTNQKCFIITSVDLYLLGVLNSQAVWQYILLSSPDLRGGYAEPRRDLMASISIPTASDADRAAIAALVQKCLDAQGIGCEEWEREIDWRVAGLYGV